MSHQRGRTWIDERFNGSDKESTRSARHSSLFIIWCVIDYSSSSLGLRASRPPRAPQGARILQGAQLQTSCSRCALTAGGPPAVPVKSLSGQAKVATKESQRIKV